MIKPCSSLCYSEPSPEDTPVTESLLITTKYRVAVWENPSDNTVAELWRFSAYNVL